MNRLTAGIIVTLALAFGGCSTTDELAGDCIITAQGAKLCGGDAEAWCNTTDALRESAGDALSDPTYGDPSLAQANRESQSVCDSIRP